MFVALSVIGILLVIAAIVLTLWWTISQAHYDNVYLKPGDEYEVGDDVYTIPAHLTIRGDKTVRKLKALTCGSFLFCFLYAWQPQCFSSFASILLQNKNVEKSKQR